MKKHSMIALIAIRPSPGRRPRPSGRGSGARGPDRPGPRRRPDPRSRPRGHHRGPGRCPGRLAPDLAPDRIRRRNAGPASKRPRRRSCRASSSPKKPMKTWAWPTSPSRAGRPGRSRKSSRPPARVRRHRAGHQALRQAPRFGPGRAQGRPERRVRPRPARHGDPGRHAHRRGPLGRGRPPRALPGFDSPAVLDYIVPERAAALDNREFDYDLLVRPMEGRMMRSIWRIVRHREAAEDALQDALAVIWKKRDAVARHPKPEALILRIAVSAALDAVRKNRRRLRHETPGLADDRAGDTAPPLESEDRRPRSPGRRPRGHRPPPPAAGHGRAAPHRRGAVLRGDRPGDGLFRIDGQGPRHARPGRIWPGAWRVAPGSAGATDRAKEGGS